MNVNELDALGDPRLEDTPSVGGVGGKVIPSWAIVRLLTVPPSRLDLRFLGQLRCRQGDRDPVVALLATPAGCVVFPDDRTQALCLHHAMRLTGEATVDAYDRGVATILAMRYDLTAWQETQHE